MTLDSPPSRQKLRMVLGPAAVLAVLLGLFACERKPPPNFAAMDVDSAFVHVIIPILADQCEDCHFTGGPMYKKMPFDNLDVVEEQGDLLLIQLEGEGQTEVRRWLEEVRRRRAMPPGDARQP